MRSEVSEVERVIVLHLKCICLMFIFPVLIDSYLPLDFPFLEQPLLKNGTYCDTYYKPILIK